MERVFSSVAARSCAPSALRREAAAAAPFGSGGALPPSTTVGAIVLSESVAETIWNELLSPSGSIGTAPMSCAPGRWAASFARSSASCGGVRPHSMRKCIRPPLTPPLSARASVVNFRNRNSGVPSGRRTSRSSPDAGR